MPYKFQTIKWKLLKEADRRFKFDDDDIMLVKSLYKQSGLILQTVRDFIKQTHKVISRRYVQLILFPERLEHQKRLYKERRKDGVIETLEAKVDNTKDKVDDIVNAANELISELEN